MWIPATIPLSIRDKAKEKTHKALNNKNNNNYLNLLLWAAKALVFSRAVPRLKKKRALLSKIKKAIYKLNITLPDKYTKVIYNILNKRNTKILI